MHKSRVVQLPKHLNQLVLHRKLILQNKFKHPKSVIILMDKYMVKIIRTLNINQFRANSRNNNRKEDSNYRVVFLD